MSGRGRHLQTRAARRLYRRRDRRRPPCRLAPRRLRALASALVVPLPVGGAAFLVDDDALTAALYVSLPLLHAWAGATGFVVGRRPR